MACSRKVPDRGMLCPKCKAKTETLKGEFMTWKAFAVLFKVLGVLALSYFTAWACVMYSYWAKPAPMQDDELSGFRGPVDVVFTWVDGDDDAWREAQRHWRDVDNMGAQDPRRNPAPGLDKDELYFSLRSVLHFMPWVRRVYILTQRPHAPQWVRDKGCEKVHIVHHDEVFASSAPLPSFSGLLNKSQAHRISGLSEHFIMMDDDFFIGRPLQPGHFFDRDGRPVYKMSFPMAPWTKREQWASILRTTHRVTREVARSPWMLYLNHVPVPLVKSACQTTSAQLEARDISLSRHRRASEPEFHYIVANTLLAQGQTRRPHASFKAQHITQAAKVHRQVRELQTKTPHVFCINSAFDAAVVRSLEQLYGSWLSPSVGGQSPRRHTSQIEYHRRLTGSFR